MKSKLFISFLISLFFIPGILLSQFIQQGPKLVGTGNIGAAGQGYSVAISTDGSTFAEGGANDNNEQGAIWVFTKTGGAWLQQGTKLVGTGSVGNFIYQGSSVSVSADGNTLVEGAYGDNSNKGAVWCFSRTGSTWSQVGGKLVGSGSTGSSVFQGFSIAISADGNTFVVGGPADNSFVGAAWVFTRNGNTWTQQGSKLVGTGFVSASRQGQSVAISSDGNTIAVGGMGDNSLSGAIWIYTRSNGVWSQQGQKLVGTGAAPGGASQGQSVSLSADGNTLVEGGSSDNADIGACWVFTRTGNVWTQQGSKLIGSAELGSGTQGFSVSISPDGNNFVEGGKGDNVGKGAVWVFNRSGGVWSQIGAKIIGTDGIGIGEQGHAVSISGDGTFVEAGESDNNGTGAVWVFNDPAIGIRNLSSDQPKNFSLSQNYPNPFNPGTKFKFQISKLSDTRLSVFDVLGREVAMPVNEKLNPGTYEVDFDASKLSSGVYFYSLTAGDYSQTMKMILIK